MTALNDWPIVISDAPIRCGRCDERIIGSGTGPLSVLSDAIKRHRATCEPPSCSCGSYYDDTPHAEDCDGVTGIRTGEGGRRVGSHQRTESGGGG